MLRFAYDQISKKRLLALILAGLVWAGGKAMAMPVEVDSATKGMPGRVKASCFRYRYGHR